MPSEYNLATVLGYGLDVFTVRCYFGWTGAFWHTAAPPKVHTTWIHLYVTSLPLSMPLSTDHHVISRIIWVYFSYYNYVIVLLL